MTEELYLGLAQHNRLKGPAVVLYRRAPCHEKTTPIRNKDTVRSPIQGRVLPAQLGSSLSSSGFFSTSTCQPQSAKLPLVTQNPASILQAFSSCSFAIDWTGKCLRPEVSGPCRTHMRLLLNDAPYAAMNSGDYVMGPQHSMYTVRSAGDACTAWLCMSSLRIDQDAFYIVEPCPR